MRQQTIYKDLARYYDLLYAWKDYAKETSTVRRLIARYKKSAGNDLLEVACGTGKHAEHLKSEFNVVATDANAGMLRVARRNVKGVTFRKADMVTLRLGREFDAVVCMFSSIGYVRTYPRLKRTIENFARHLKKGGVLILEPWFNKATVEHGRPSLAAFNGNDLKIARASVFKVRGDVSVMEMNYLVAERGKRVRYYVGSHIMGLFDPDKTLAFMESAGLRPRFVKDKRSKVGGLFVGLKL